MKRKLTAVSMFTILGAVLLLTLTACGAFFIPELPRTNPNDSDAPAAPVDNLEAIITSPDYIEIRWDLPAEREPVSLAIIRSTTAQPLTTSDGTRYDISDVAAGTWTDENVEQDNTYFYGVWSVAEDGTEVGPVQTKAEITYKTLELEPEIDGYADNAPTVNFSAGTMYVRRAAAIDQAVCVMEFDLTQLPDIFDSAELELSASSVMTAQIVKLYKITETWDEASLTWAQAVAASFYGNVAISVRDINVTGPGIFNVDILDAVREMRENENNGFLIRPSTADVDVTWVTTEGTQPPKLIVTYWGNLYAEE